MTPATELHHCLTLFDIDVSCRQIEEDLMLRLDVPRDQSRKQRKIDLFAMLEAAAAAGRPYRLVVTGPSLSSDDPSDRDVQEFYRGILAIQEYFTEPAKDGLGQPKQHLPIVVLKNR